jgi:transposase
MPSLTKKIIRGRPYYYLRECKRVNGKPKIVWQQYLGPASELAERLAGPSPKGAAILEFGASAACLDIAQQLDVAGIIDRHIKKRDNGGPTVGQYMLIAALNRCLAPCSKAQIGAWFSQTVLGRLLQVSAPQLSSQRFWKSMSRIDERAITAIERDLAQAAVTGFGLDLRCLLFDATNFFTFVDSFNLRPAMPQRGHSKEGRDGLRIVGLALLVTSDGDVPLFHHSYAGNQHDATTFGAVIPEIAGRCRKLSQAIEDITVVFDKGNNSEDNLTLVKDSNLHFVGSLVPTQHAELLAIDRRKMRRLDTAVLPAVWSYRTTKVVFGVKRTVLVTFNKPLFETQMKTLRREINKRQSKLRKLAAVLDRSADRAGGQKASLDGARKRLSAILAGRHMKELFSASISPGKSDTPKLTWRVDEKAWKRLQTTLLGKSILFTDREKWTDEQIVRGYRSQHHVESAFRSMKDPRCLTFRPMHHWTDQKLRVHALYCVIALMILSLLRRNLAKAGIAVSLARMVERLTDMREVAVSFHDNNAHAPRPRMILSDLDAEQQQIFDTLDLGRFRLA